MQKWRLTIISFATSSSAEMGDSLSGVRHFTQHPVSTTGAAGIICMARRIIPHLIIIITILITAACGVPQGGGATSLFATMLIISLYFHLIKMANWNGAM